MFMPIAIAVISTLYSYSCILDGLDARDEYVSKGKLSKKTKKILFKGSIVSSILWMILMVLVF